MVLDEFLKPAVGPLATGAGKSSFVAGIVLIVFGFTVAAATRDNAGFAIAAAVGITGIVAVVAISTLQMKANRKASRKPSPARNESPDTYSMYKRLKPQHRDQIRLHLSAGIEAAASALLVPVVQLRANLFGCDANDQMRMIPDVRINMNHVPEYGLTIPAGYGSTGRCYKNADANVAFLRENWGVDAISDHELKKVEPRLKWIISLPVWVHGNVTWVLNIDSLVAANEAVVRAAAPKLAYTSGAVGLVLETVVRPAA